MTTVNAPTQSFAGYDDDPAPRPVPWRNLVWVTWRQHRVALIGATAVLGALAIYLLVMGLRIHHAWAGVTACHPASSLACRNLLNTFTTTYSPAASLIAVLLQVVAPLIGAFVGAPVLGRELESGTFRFAWTQGFGRARWTAGKLAILAAVLVVEAEAFSLLFNWYYQPFLSDGLRSPLSGTVFDLRGVTFAAWTLFAFAIAAFAGMLIRRVVPAIAATLASWTALAVVTAVYLRAHYLTPLLTNNPNLAAPGSYPPDLAVSNSNLPLVVRQYYTGANGKPAPKDVLNALLARYQPPAIRVGRVSFQKTIDPVNYLISHGYTQWTSYQPASRFWSFQLIETGWLLALSLILIIVTVLLAQRRSN
jgi:hypothetical protein